MLEHCAKENVDLTADLLRKHEVFDTKCEELPRAKEAEEPHPSVIRREARQDFLTRASLLMKRVKPEQEAQSRRRTGASFRRFLGTANSAEPAAPLDS